jgi:hypothetical protein
VSHASSDGTDRLGELVDDLLVRDADVHARAVGALADEGDERVVHDPPRYLELPEVRWPGVRDALAALTEVDFDSDHAWVEWETWYSQQEITPLEGFDAWKLRLYRSYLPPVGGLLDCAPRTFDLQDIRWGNCDRSFLAALNAPEFVPVDAVDVVVARDSAGAAGGPVRGRSRRL